jgi:hypothetical protein
MALAEMNGIDLDSEIEHKLDKNLGRTYERTADGVLVRTREQDPQDRKTS